MLASIHLILILVDSPIPGEKRFISGALATESITFMLTVHLRLQNMPLTLPL